MLGGKPSSDANDERAVAVVREIADVAAASGLRVALYPHVKTYVQRVEDGLRLVKKADRKNLGVAFNLCHFLKGDDAKNIERGIREAAPHLFLVSINGADAGETNKMGWDRLIQRLGSGSFDVGRVLKALDGVHYSGPVLPPVLSRARRPARESGPLDGRLAEAQRPARRGEVGV